MSVMTCMLRWWSLLLLRCQGSGNNNLQFRMQRLDSEHQTTLLNNHIAKRTSGIRHATRLVVAESRPNEVARNEF